MFPDREPRITHRSAIGSDIELSCPSCGYSLRGIGAYRCPECGEDLEFEPVAVFCAADLSLVWVAGMVLDRHAISNVIVTSGPDVLGGLFLDKSGMPRLMVPFKFFFEAVALLEQEFGGRMFKAGQKPPPPPQLPDWVCPGCGESNPSAFEICWQCSRERSPSESEQD